MKQYKLAYVMYEPCEDTNDLYMAEIPAMPGCRAWGESPGETLYNLEGTAEAFIQSYLERELELPCGVAESPVKLREIGEVTVRA